MIDREKAIKGLEVVRDAIVDGYIHEPDRAVNAITDAIALLKEQEAVTPYIDIDEAKCPICKVKLTRQELLGDDVLFEDFFDYCPHCGRTVKWE